MILALLLAASAPAAASSMIDPNRVASMRRYMASLGADFPLGGLAPSVRLLIKPAFEPARVITLSMVGRRWRVEHLTGSSISGNDLHAPVERRTFLLDAADQDAFEAALRRARGARWPQGDIPSNDKICVDGVSYVLESKLEDRPVIAYRHRCGVESDFMPLVRAIVAVGHDEGTL